MIVMGTGKSVPTARRYASYPAGWVPGAPWGARMQGWHSLRPMYRSKHMLSRSDMFFDHMWWFVRAAVRKISRPFDAFLGPGGSPVGGGPGAPGGATLWKTLWAPARAALPNIMGKLYGNCIVSCIGPIMFPIMFPMMFGTAGLPNSLPLPPPLGGPGAPLGPTISLGAPGAPADLDMRSGPHCGRQQKKTAKRKKNAP